MPAGLREIIISYIDEALDVDDLENIGDYVRSVINVENLGDWQMAGALKQLHMDLAELAGDEPDPARRLRMKAALSSFEADFSDYLIAKEVESLATGNNR